MQRHSLLRPILFLSFLAILPWANPAIAEETEPGLQVSIIDLTFNCADLTGTLTYSSNQSPFYVFVTYNYPPVKGVGFSGTVSEPSGTLLLQDPYNTHGTIPESIAVLAGSEQDNTFYVGGLNVSCETVPPPQLEIHQVVLTCDGTVTFEVVDPNAIREGDVAWLTFYNGAYIFDGPKAVPLATGVSHYSSRVPSSENWPDGFMMRAEISWGPETQANGTIDPDVCVIEVENPPLPSPTATTQPDSQLEQSNVIVTLVLPEGVDVSGAPYSLYAAQATVEFLADPYLTGTVGSGNMIQIDNVPSGTYKLVVIPQGHMAIEAIIEVTTEPITELLVRVESGEPGSTPPPVENETPIVKNSEPVKQSSEEIVSLPNTGSGGSFNSVGLHLLQSMLVLSLLLVPTGTSRFKRTR